MAMKITFANRVDGRDKAHGAPLPPKADRHTTKHFDFAQYKPSGSRTAGQAGVRGLG